MTRMKRLRDTAMAQTALMALMVPAALALVPSAARADIPIEAKVYGFLNAQLEAVWANGGATPYRTTGRVSDGNSRIGFKGAIALGERTKVLWQIEAGLNNFEQGGANDLGILGTIVSRNTFVGVEDERIGRLVIGNNESAYRSLVGSAGELGGNLGLTKLGLDLWNNTSAQMSGNPWSIFSRGEARYKNSVHYTSADWAGFRVAGSYSFDELVPAGGRRDRFSLGVAYTLGELRIGAGFDYQRNTGVNVANLELGLGLHTHAENHVATFFYKAVVSYKLPSRTYLGVGVERSNYGYVQFIPPTPSSPSVSEATGVMSQFSVMASAAQEIGDHFALMVSFGRLGSLAGSINGLGADFAALQLSVGAKYSFNDVFAAYLFYTLIQNAAQQDINFGQSPVYTNNMGTATAYLAPGNGPNAVGLGVIARF